MHLCNLRCNNGRQVWQSFGRQSYYSILNSGNKSTALGYISILYIDIDIIDIHVYMYLGVCMCIYTGVGKSRLTVTL